MRSEKSSYAHYRLDTHRLATIGAGIDPIRGSFVQIRREFSIAIVGADDTAAIATPLSVLLPQSVARWLVGHQSQDSSTQHAKEAKKCREEADDADHQQRLQHEHPWGYRQGRVVLAHQVNRRVQRVWQEAKTAKHSAEKGPATHQFSLSEMIGRPRKPQRRVDACEPSKRRAVKQRCDDKQQQVHLRTAHPADALRQR